eukprot:SAG11_NODE_5783_length_1465_cov_0.834553_3_plen_121_part_00
MAEFSTTTEVKYPDGTVQNPTTPMAAKSKWAPWHDDNIILLTDSYKLTHFRQYPPGTETVYSYFESRGGKFPEINFFGLQYFIKRYFVGQVRARASVGWEGQWGKTTVSPVSEQRDAIRL